MKQGLKVWTAVSAFSPAVFFVFGIIMSLANMFMNINANEPMSDVGGTASMPDRMVLLSIIFAILPIIIITLFCAFNMIFDIIYIVRSGRFTSESTVLWIVMTLLFGIVTAPIFWILHLRTLTPGEPMFPPKSAEQP